MANSSISGILIYYQNEDIEVAYESGISILNTSLTAGINHAHVCGGNAKCSTCRILVLKGIENCTPRNNKENIIAKKLGFPEKVRLACQTKIKNNISIRRPVIDEVDKKIYSINASQKQQRSQGVEKLITAIFCDLEGYTSFTEKNEPYDVMHILNRYFFVMGNVVKKYNGRIIDYYGDGFLAVFGLEKPMDQCLKTIEAGKEMILEMVKLNKYTGRYYSREFNIRLGASYGPTVVGTLGMLEMSKYAAVGDTVNYASRLESANKDLGTRFLVSKSVYENCQEKHHFNRSFVIKVKGKEGEQKVYEVV